MRARHAILVAGLALLLAAVTASAEPPIPPDQPIKNDTPMPPLSVPAGGRPLRDVLADVQKSVPSFHCVVTSDPGMADNEPVLPPMQLTDLTIGQFLQFVNDTYPKVTIHRIDGAADKPPLYALNVGTPDDGGGGHTQSLFTPPAPPPVEPPTLSVRVVSLSELVRPRAAAKTGDGDRTRLATDDVLSAVQAALDVAALPGPPATVKVHQPTLTLIVRGTDAQLKLVDQTLKSLQPTENQLVEQVAGLQAANDALHAENAELKRRATSATRPSGGGGGGNSGF
jgi:hypothetical protein